ncbi:MAG: cytidylate kinase family protein [Bryobacteraceae bacterium]|nr:cytidylate kinase family protein [Bryobacteraceae bacterium]
MSLVTISGEPGCRQGEVGRLTAQALGFELITEGRLEKLLDEEYGTGRDIPDKAYPAAVASVLVRLATEHHLVVTMTGAEGLFPRFANVLRVHVVAPEPARTGLLMVDRRMDRPTAKKLLKDMETERRAFRRRRFGRATVSPHAFDLIVNCENLDVEAAAAVICAAADQRALREAGLVSSAAEAQMQFRLRLDLAKHGIQPNARARLRRASFGHPSEEIFANLLDFYRIGWEYEPRSFPIAWDKDGKVLESFTPDFYLPEFDLYVELTTMKQSLVTKKNRKVKLLRQIYPGINIQVFYEKDFQNLIFKYGLAERVEVK